MTPKPTLSEKAKQQLFSLNLRPHSPQSTEALYGLHGLQGSLASLGSLGSQGKEQGKNSLTRRLDKLKLGKTEGQAESMGQVGLMGQVGPGRVPEPMLLKRLTKDHPHSSTATLSLSLSATVPVRSEREDGGRQGDEADTADEPGREHVQAVQYLQPVELFDTHALMALKRTHPAREPREQDAAPFDFLSSFGSLPGGTGRAGGGKRKKDKGGGDLMLSLSSSSLMSQLSQMTRSPGQGPGSKGMGEREMKAEKGEKREKRERIVPAARNPPSAPGGFFFPTLLSQSAPIVNMHTHSDQ